MFLFRPSSIFHQNKQPCCFKKGIRHTFDDDILSTKTNLGDDDFEVLVCKVSLSMMELHFYQTKGLVTQFYAHFCVLTKNLKH